MYVLRISAIWVAENRNTLTLKPLYLQLYTDVENKIVLLHFNMKRVYANRYKRKNKRKETSIQ